MSTFTKVDHVRKSPTNVSEPQRKQKLWKSEFSIEIPAGKYQNLAGIFKILAVLGYATGTFEINPIKDTDPTLGHLNEYPKEDDTEGWDDKYLFNSKRIRNIGMI